MVTGGTFLSWNQSSLDNQSLYVILQKPHVYFGNIIKQKVWKYNSIGPTSRLWIEITQSTLIVFLGLNGWWQVFWLNVTVLPWLISASSIWYTKKVWKICFRVAHLSSTGRHWCGSGSVTLMWSYFKFVIGVMKFEAPTVYIAVWTHHFFVVLWVSNTIVITNRPTTFFPCGSSIALSL